MPPSQCVTETLILHLKEGVILENVAFGDGGGASGSQAVVAFVQLNNILKAQHGFIRQFWGHQVEEQTIFVWSIDWESFEHNTAFTNSEEYKAFMAGVSQVFDLDVAAPLTMYTRFTTDPIAALEAPVTEVALYTLPTEDYTEEVKTKIDDATNVPSMQAITTVGKSPGGATGWVFETQYAAEPDGRSIALHGVFGYPSVDDHRRWRESPEHAQVMEDLGSFGDLALQSATVPGGNIFVPGESMFHVKFHPGM